LPAEFAFVRTYIVRAISLSSAKIEEFVRPVGYETDGPKREFSEKKTDAAITEKSYNVSSANTVSRVRRNSPAISLRVTLKMSSQVHKFVRRVFSLTIFLNVMSNRGETFR